MDPNKFAIFVQEMKECLGDLLLTTSFSTTIRILKQEIDILRCMEYFDLVNVLPFRSPYYDNFMVDNTVEGVMSEFNPSNIRSKIDHLITKCGIAAWKIVLGFDETNFEFLTAQ